MKKIIASAVISAALSVSASAYFDGGITGTTGPHGYSGTKLDLVIGSGNFALQPSLATYKSDVAGTAAGKTFRTYELRGAMEADKYTVAAFAGTTPEVADYSNKFAGGDITFSLTPGSGSHSRLAGPGSRSGARGGQGITRVDVGVGLKHTLHTQVMPVTDRETSQTEASMFGGAKIMMVNLAASYTAYSYGDEDATPRGFVPGLSFAQLAKPKSSVNVKLDIPGYPMVTPYVSYTGTKYKGGADNSSAYLFGAYIDLSMVMANVGYQIFDNGNTKDNFITFGAGIKF
ncbi:MAG: hypothetical protein A2234_02080 [Elusimicrobia bacterium RIFOXYA2_FULL_58_8]|nr:MAG: hypothetical protein A2285_01815 [Elusimicrobia bacterium RIFOXYA12_FULL_57_11]OGS17386.1 MAG: hypothetical protein A2234_02080 [Elusimicrobia bacterium RIFOXYA2_FULL_58_8]